jgi:hypothetical protein
MAAGERPPSRIEVDDDGSVVAFADVDRPEGSDAARATLHVEGGHRPPGTGARLVDAVLETDEVREAGAVVAAVPKGEGEAIEKAHERLPDAITRQAGATVIVEGQLPREE